MDYKDEWLLLEADDDIDEMEHREPTEEFLFYRAVASGDVEQVRKNCEQGRFMEEEGVGVLSRDPVTNLKYHFVITTAMITKTAWSWNRPSGSATSIFRSWMIFLQKNRSGSFMMRWSWILRKKCGNISEATPIPDI